ncbi:MAG: hypothetical protein KGI08_09300, partial [Thaumarchaeota archaeon]|nr:hypothetical protein [Nitrososphaerota archaeon]
AAALKSFYRLNITWTGDDSATITLYNTTPTTFPFVWTQIGQQTVKSFQTTQIGYLSVPLEIHMFIQTLTTAARSTFIWEYSIGFL